MVMVGTAAGLSDGVYEVTQSFLSIGRVYRVVNPSGALVAYVKHPLARLREEFNIYADEGETAPILNVKRRKIVQINAAYDLRDPGGTLVATLQRRGLRSLLRDRLELLDATGQPVGAVDETGFALARRFIKWLPHHWRISLGNDTVAILDQRFTFFAKRVRVDLTSNRGRLDPRVPLAAALMLIHEVHSASSAVE